MDASMNATLRAKEYDRLGLKPPAEAARLLEIIRATNAAAFADPMAGIDYDKLTTTNVAKQLREAAVTQAVKSGMQQLSSTVTNQLGRRVNAEFAADIDRVTEELRPGYLEAAAVITEAISSGLDRATFGDSAKILNAGPAAAGLYHRTVEALAHLTAVRSFLNVGRSSIYDVASVLTLTAKAHADTLDAAQQIANGLGGDDRFLELYALPGVVPALNTAEQAKEVVAHSAELRRASEAARKAAAEEDWSKRNQAWAYLAGQAR